MNLSGDWKPNQKIKTKLLEKRAQVKANVLVWITGEEGLRGKTLEFTFCFHLEINAKKCQALGTLQKIQIQDRYIWFHFFFSKTCPLRKAISVVVPIPSSKAEKKKKQSLVGVVPSALVHLGLWKKGYSRELSIEISTQRHPFPT